MITRFKNMKKVNITSSSPYTPIEKGVECDEHGRPTLVFKAVDYSKRPKQRASDFTIGAYLNSGLDQQGVFARPSAPDPVDALSSVREHTDVVDAVLQAQRELIKEQTNKSE